MEEGATNLAEVLAGLKVLVDERDPVIQEVNEKKRVVCYVENGREREATFRRIGNLVSEIFSEN